VLLIQPSCPSEHVLNDFACTCCIAELLFLSVNDDGDDEYAVESAVSYIVIVSAFGRH